MKKISAIFWAFPALMSIYIVFLSDLGDIFDYTIRHSHFLNGMDQVLSIVFNIQFIALIMAALLVSGALAFQAGASSHRFLKYIPLVFLLIPIITLLFSWKCVFGLVSSAVCSGPSILPPVGWGNLVIPPFLLGLLVLALAVSRSRISTPVLRLALVPLGVVTLGMFFQLTDVLSWGIAAWPTTQARASYLAYGYDRQLWPGDWHIWLALGLALLLFVVGFSVRAVWLSGASLVKKASPESS